MWKMLTKCCEKSASDETQLKEEEDSQLTSNGKVNGVKHTIPDTLKINGIVIDGNTPSTDIAGNEGEHIDTPDGSGPSFIEEILDPKHYYNMYHKRRGMALIFNHEIFDCNSPRKGTSADRDRLMKTLEALHFDVKIFEDESYGEIKGILQEIAAMDHSDNDCLMIIVLSHGDIVPLVDRRGKKYTTILTHDLVSYLHASDNKYPLQTIWEQFTDEKCPSLANKPKIFLIQACQGDNADEGFGVPMESARRNRAPGTDSTRFFSTKYKPFDPVQIDKKKTLPQKDFLIVYSTMPGYYSYRDTVMGTWFIESLCKVLDEKKHDMDFFQILTVVNRTVAMDYQSDGAALKQMPCIVSMLTKLVMFPRKTPVINGF